MVALDPRRENAEMAVMERMMCRVMARSRIIQRAGRFACAGRMLLWCIGLLLLPAAGSADALERGRALAQSVYERPAGEDVSTRGTMVLTDPGREPRVRELFVFRRDRGNGDVSTLIRFTAPSDIAGTGLLTIDHPDGASDQWVFLPALGSSRRVPSARRGGRFVGSDFFYEDLQDRKLEMDTHRWLRTETLHGVPTEVLESVPVDPANSVYGRRASWIHPDSLLPIQVDFFRPGRSEPFKRSSVQRAELIQGYWTITHTLMTDLESGHTTSLIATTVEYDRGLPDTLFSSRTLEDPALEQPFRP